MYFSHAERLHELSNHQMSLFSAEGPLEARLDEAMLKLADTIGTMQALQQRNESLSTDNARISQQVSERDGQLLELVKERDSLISIRRLLEEKVHKCMEDLAVMQERAASFANQKPVTGDDLQAALLRTENLTLKGELELLKESRRRDSGTHQNLSQQIEVLKVREIQS